MSNINNPCVIYINDEEESINAAYMIYNRCLYNMVFRSIKLQHLFLNKLEILDPFVPILDESVSSAVLMNKLVDNEFVIINNVNKDTDDYILRLIENKKAIYIKCSQMD